MIRKMIPLGGGNLHGNWEQTVTGIWMFKMTGGSYAKNRWGQTRPWRSARGRLRETVLFQPGI